MFRYWGLHARCLGGPPGNCCADGRDASSISCAECEPEKVPVVDGSCKTCQEYDNTVSVIVATLVFVLPCLVYLLIDTTEHTRENLSVLLCSMTFSMSQQLGVIASFAVKMEEPLIT